MTKLLYREIGAFYGCKWGGGVGPSSTAYLLEGCDRRPALVQSGNEGGRGGGMVVLPGLRQEVRHRQILRQHHIFHHFHAKWEINK